MFHEIQDVFYFVQDMDLSVAFYRDTLGLKMIEETAHWSAFDIGGLRLGLHWTGGDAVHHGPTDGHGHRGGATLTFRTDDIDRVHTLLEKREVRHLTEIGRDPWGSLLSFADPDGNVLKVMQPPKE